MARNSTKSQTVVKDFSKLTALMEQTRNVVMPIQIATMPQQATTGWVHFHAEDDITDVIWKIMSDGKGRTVGDISTILKPATQYDVRDIEQALAFFHMKGCMLKTNQHIPIYTLKGNAMQPKASKTKVKEAEKKNATQLGLLEDTEGMTIFERADLAVYDLMADRKARDVDQIVAGCCNSELTRLVLSKRLESLFRGHWFDRKPGKTYVLSKTAIRPTAKALKQNKAEFDQTEVVTPKPHIDNVVPIAPKPTITASAGLRVEPAKADMYIPTLEDGLSTSIWKVMADREYYTVHEVAALLDHVGIQYQPIANRLSQLHLHSGWFERKYVGEGRNRCYSYSLKDDVLCPAGETAYSGPARKELIRVAKLKAKDEARIGVREHLKPEDNTPPSVGVAMERAGINATSAENRSTILGPTTKAAIADVVAKEIEVPAPAANDAAPAPEPTHAPRSAPSAAAITDVKALLTGMADACHEAQNPTPAPKQKEEQKMSVSQEQAVQGPIVQIKVDIKGIPFTLLEAEQLMPEILRMGYSTPASMKQSSGLIQTSTTIKGVGFSPQELCDVFRGLKAAGIGKNVQ